MEEKKKSGLAVAGLVLGIIGICLSFIPIINNVAFFLGILAIIFGVITLVKKVGGGKAIAALVLGILSIIITLAMQSAISDALDETSKELDKITGESTEEVLKTDVDVKVGEFVVKEGEYLTETELVVDVKNLTDKKKSFTIHIEAIAEDGSRIDDDYVYANDLNAGQSQQFKIFEYVENEKLDAMKKATFKIVEASSM